MFLLLSSFWPEISTLVQVFNKIGLIYVFLPLTPLILDLEHITLSPTTIPFPMLGHLCWNVREAEAGVVMKILLKELVLVQSECYHREMKS